MYNLSFTACSFFLQKSHAQGLDDIPYLNKTIQFRDSTGHSLSKSVKDLFVDFFNSRNSSLKDDDYNKTFSCNYDNSYSGECENFHYFYTIISSGIYGSSSIIKDPETNTITHRKTASESDERPFILFIVLPKDNGRVKVQKGMLFFQNVGPYGVKTITTKYIRRFFSEYYGLIFRSATISPELFIKKIITPESVNRIYLTMNHKSTDVADQLFPGYGCETRELAHLRFTAPIWDNIMKNILYFSKGKSNLFEFEHKEYSGLKVQVKIGDRYRTLDINHLDSLSIIEPIPDEIKLADGHPKIDKLIDYFVTVADDYLKELVTQIVEYVEV